MLNYIAIASVCDWGRYGSDTRVPDLDTYFPHILHGNSSPSYKFGGEEHGAEPGTETCPIEPCVWISRAG